MVNAVQATEPGTVDVMRTTNTQKKKLKRTRKGKDELNVVEEDGAYVGLWSTWQDEELQGGLPETMDVLDDNAVEVEDDDDEPRTSAAAGLTKRFPTKCGVPDKSTPSSTASKSRTTRAEPT
jgi:hypothetical protein